MKNFKKGFTLIELLVVIAIISLLTSVALASLATARAKAADATIQETMNSIRTQAALYASENPSNPNGNVGGCDDAGTLFADPMMTGLIDAIQAAANGTVICSSGLNETGVQPPGYSGPAGVWFILAPLRSTGAGTSWCVDSTGVSKFIPAGNYAASGLCPTI